MNKMGRKNKSFRVKLWSVMICSGFIPAVLPWNNTNTSLGRLKLLHRCQSVQLTSSGPVSYKFIQLMLLKICFCFLCSAERLRYHIWFFLHIRHNVSAFRKMWLSCFWHLSKCHKRKKQMEFYSPSHFNISIILLNQPFLKT